MRVNARTAKPSASRRVLDLCVLAALLLSSFPTAQAAPVGLQATGAASDGQVEASAAPGAVVTVTTTYTLSLDLSTASRLRLTSELSTSSSPPTKLNHAAQWLVGSESLGPTTLNDEKQTASSFGPSGTVSVRVTWSLPATVPAGAYDLRIAVQSEAGTGNQDGAGAGNSPAAIHGLDLVLTRTTGGAGGQGSSSSSSSQSSSASNSQSSAPSQGSDSSTTSHSSTTTTSSTSSSGTILPPVELRVPAPAEFIAALAAASAGELQLGDLVVVRDAATGLLLGLESQIQPLQNLRVAGDQDLVFLETPETGRPLVLLVGLGEVHVVQRPPAEVVQDAVVAGGDLTLRVAQKSGWIEVIAPDRHPGRTLIGAVAIDENGTERAIPMSLLWRDQGGLHLLDDPTTTYALRFAEPGAPSSLTTQATDDGDSLLRLALVAGAGIVVGVALAVLLVRRRR